MILDPAQSLPVPIEPDDEVFARIVASDPTLSEMFEPPVDVNSRASLTRWLVWNDPNGCYTDADCAEEGCEPCTLEELRDIYRFATADDTAPLIATLESGRHLS